MHLTSLATITLLLSTFTLAQTVTPSGSSSTLVKRSYPVLQTGISYSNNTIKVHRGPFSECAAACDAVPSCIGFVRNEKLKMNCALKSKFDTDKLKVTRNRTTFAIQGVLPEAKKFREIKGKASMGKTLKKYYTLDRKLCAFACSVTKDCLAFNFLSATKRGCTLKGNGAKQLTQKESRTKVTWVL